MLKKIFAFDQSLAGKQPTVLVVAAAEAAAEGRRLAAAFEAAGFKAVSLTSDRRR